MDQVKPGATTSRAAAARVLGSTATDRNAVVPIEAPRRERGSLWKRLSVRRSVRRAHLLSDTSSSEALLQRLDSIEEQLRGVEGAIQLSTERIETRFLQFWEMEEQFGEVAAKMAELETSQRDAAERTRILSRSVTFLAIFALLASCAALILSLPLGG
jgi:hypothetical protein